VRERDENLLCIQGAYCVKLYYIEISAEQQSSTSTSSSPERQPSTSRGEPQPSTSREEPQPSTSREEPQPSTSREESQHSPSGQSLSGSDYVLQELAPVELHSDADLKGILVSSLYYTIYISFCVFISICFIHEF